jgi:Cys-rich peptide (TIGR04165 family)
MNIGKLDRKCPECGSKDKTIKRDIESEHHAHATTGAVKCSDCGYIFVSGKKKEDNKENK